MHPRLPKLRRRSTRETRTVSYALKHCATLNQWTEQPQTETLGLRPGTTGQPQIRYAAIRSPLERFGPQLYHHSSAADRSEHISHSPSSRLICLSIFSMLSSASCVWIFSIFFASSRVSCLM